jgi:alpha-galactosidase
MLNTQPVISRRKLLKGVAGPSAAAMLLPQTLWSQQQNGVTPSVAQAALGLPVLSQPDMALAFVGGVEASRFEFFRSGSDWTANSGAGGTRIRFISGARHSTISLESPANPIQRVHLRWKCKLPSGVLVLGDAWERSYGDLGWRHLQPERAMPWYAMLQSEGQTAGMGVKTGAASFAFWQADLDGISLWLDVRNGGNGVRLGNRKLDMATIVAYAGAAGESAFSATRHLCRLMAEGTEIPAKRGSAFVDVIYGSNDWYYAYGHNTADRILRDADLVKSLEPSGGPRPFTVIDDGYQDRSRFPDIAQTASDIRSRGVIPGIWIRPLRAAATVPANLLLPGARFKLDGSKPPPLAYDPTIPEALEAVAAVASQACAWGYDLIKHDFTTFELLGQWGSQMGASPTQGNWRFNDPALTNAEIVTLLYKRLRSSCGEDRIVLGCNTIGHLSVGLFDLSRTGDDVSGREWERTRRTGVNTLAFRLPQHKRFFTLDPDIVPVTPDLAWSKSREWLQAVAHSGTVLLVSPDSRATGKEQLDAIRQAFELCVHKPASEPLNWVDSRTPSAWRSSSGTETYNWILEEGESPFPIGIQRGPA